MGVQYLALLSGLRIWHCRELWHRLQSRFRFYVAVALVQAGSCSSNSIPGLRTSICCRCGPERQKKKKKKNKLESVCASPWGLREAAWEKSEPHSPPAGGGAARGTRPALRGRGVGSPVCTPVPSARGPSEPHACTPPRSRLGEVCQVS